MRLPFIHSTACGLVITDTEVTWVSGVRRGSRLRSVCYAHEPIEGGDVGAALARLVARVQPTSAYVAVHLDALHVRHTIIQGPAFDEEEAFAAWLEDEARRELPPGASPEDFAIRVWLLEMAESTTRCLVALARREAVAERVALLERAGLWLSSIGTLEGAAGEALRYQGVLGERRQAVLILRPDDGVLLGYTDAVLDRLTPLSCGTTSPDALAFLEEIAHSMSPSPDALYVMASETGGIAAEVRTLHLFDCPVYEVGVDVLLTEQVAPLPPRGVLALGLALQHRSAPGEALNFLEPESSARRLQEIEKREAMRAALVLSSVLSLLYLIVALLTVYLNGKHAAAETALHRLSDEVQHIERAREAVAALESDVAQAEALVTERTEFARVLKGVGRRVPESLWLEMALLETNTPEGTHMTLEGVAFYEEAVARYLERLEEAPFAAHVALSYTEALQARSLYRQAAAGDRKLTRFELRLALAAQAAGVEGAR